MALRHKVEDITLVPEAFRGEYTETLDGDKKVFVLNVEGLAPPEDVSGLKNTVEALRKEKREALDKAEKLGQDITALRTSYDTKIATADAQAKEAAKNNEAALRAATIDKAVAELSTKLSATGSKLIAPHIEKRLRVDIENGRALIRVLDEKGELTAHSLTDLENEFKSNKEFAAVITASRASGGGAGGERTVPAGGGEGGGTQGPNLTTMTPRQLADVAKARRQARGLER